MLGKRAFDFELAEQGFADNCSAGLDRTVVSERCHDGTKKAAAGRVNNTDKSEMKLGKTCMAGLQSCGPGRVRNVLPSRKKTYLLSVVHPPSRQRLGLIIIF